LLPRSTSLRRKGAYAGQAVMLELYFYGKTNINRW